ncbi:retrotransposon protein, putative, ty1-copia subclass [Tanacetum coccineum]|uniref:Retrotransposon protein, putative, ty1-copia subclass n=1 Tax=Tanacetum coccineum TaxID=301880 RepID=A0ABQ5AXG8_9ASTR
MTTTVVNNSLFRIVLSIENKLPFLDQPIPVVLPVPPQGQANPPDVITTHQAWVKAQKEIDGLMLMTMDPNIQKNLEHLGAYDMLKELKMLYVQQADQELLQTVREFHTCKQEEWQFVSSYVLKMKSYIDNLESLSHAMTQNLSVSLTLVSLRKEYDSFVQNYNMLSMGKTINELHAMLKLHEQTLPPKKSKAKMGYVPVQALSFALKPKNPPTPKKDNPAKDAICHQCGEGLRGSRKLKPRALSLYVGDGHRAAVEAIVDYHLCLSNFKNNMIYFNAIPRNDIYEIVMSSSNTNECSMYVVTNKRAKLNLDSALLWHCHLGHINKKHIEKLQHDGLFDSTDIESFEKCVACMSGKMARKPYSHQVERAKNLLGLIHTDEVENQLGKTIKSLHSDRGGEYMSQEFLDHLKDHGIIAHKTPPYTPQHNGVLKRRNQKLLDMVRSMMSQTTLPKSFWDYAFESAARILNMVQTKKVDKTPYKVWHGQTPKLIPKGNNSFYYPPEKKKIVARKAEFFENKVIDHEASGSLENLEIIQKEDTHPSIDTSLDHEGDDQEIDETQSDLNPIRRSTKTRRALDRMCLYIDAEEHELRDLGEPTNYKAALLDPEFDKWFNAMNVEMQSMKDNEVWELVKLPPVVKTVGHKWLFKKKTDMDGAVHTYKARLVAKGFTQTIGIDYEETFSPVADIRAIRILIAIAGFYGYEIWQMDVKTAFLNGYLNEEVYMEQLEGFVSQRYPNRVCKLKPSGSYVTLLILYVDDILIMGNNIPMLQDVKSYLGRCFAMKDLGEATYILRIKIYRDRSKRLIGLCQSAYIEKILKKFYMENSKRGTIPMQEKLKLSKSQGASILAEIQRMQNILYAMAVGSIMYDVRCTRPNVEFAQNIANRFQQNPGDIHWTAFKNILKYLRNTKDMFLVYGDADDIKSQTGYVFVLNGGAVDWKSTKQSIFATSSTDAEYIAAFYASKEAVWIRKFTYRFGVVPIIEEPINMYCDNTGVIAIAKDHGVTKGARHFRAKVHCFRDTIEMGDVRIEKVDTDDNLADPFTKALEFPKLSELTKKIGMIPASSLM